MMIIVAIYLDEIGLRCIGPSSTSPTVQIYIFVSFNFFWLSQVSGEK